MILSVCQASLPGLVYRLEYQNQVMSRWLDLRRYSHAPRLYGEAPHQTIQVYLRKLHKIANRLMETYTFHSEEIHKLYPFDFGWRVFILQGPSERWLVLHSVGSAVSSKRTHKRASVIRWDEMQSSTYSKCNAASPRRDKTAIRLGNLNTADTRATLQWHRACSSRVFTVEIENLERPQYSPNEPHGYNRINDWCLFHGEDVWAYCTNPYTKPNHSY
jgi:hypothetical protein